MAKASGSRDGDTKYMSLTVYGRRRMFLLVLSVVMTVCFAFLLIHNAAKSRGDVWLYAGLPMMLVGLLVVFISPSEEWKYAPWQDASQRCEKNTYS